ncbi:O-antigen ligase family protein [Pseudomonas frederiksbergensis]|uniref:O-antigen ligase family protein n=1 Tax=Pseudomonas frederiksbergensis TaxID=104087 RepID=UPI003D23D12C
MNYMSSDRTSIPKRYTSRWNLLLTLLAIFLFAFGVIPFYLDIRLHENVGLNPQRLLVAGMFGLAALCMLGSKGAQKRISLSVHTNKKIYLVIAVYLLLRVASFAANPSQYSFFILLNEVLMNFFILFYSAVFVDSVKKIKILLFILIVSALYVSIFGVVEGIISDNIFRALANTATQTGEIAAQIKIRDGNYRIQSTFEHPLALSQYLIIIIPLLVAMMSAKLWRGMALIMFLPLFLVAAYLTYARSVFVCLFIAVIIISLSTVKLKYLSSISPSTRQVYYTMHKFTVFMGFIALLGAVLFLSSGGSATQQSSTATRLVQLNNGIMGVKEKPILGHGIGNAKKVIIGIGDTVSGSEAVWNETIDSYYLAEALDSGLPALFAFVSIFVIASRVMYRISIDRTINKSIRGLALAISASIAAGAASMSVLSIFTILPILFALIGFSISLNMLSKRN